VFVGAIVTHKVEMYYYLKCESSAELYTPDCQPVRSQMLSVASTTDGKKGIKKLHKL